MASWTKKLSSDTRYSITLSVSETSTSIADNTSVVSYTLTATKSGGSGYYTSNKTNPIKVTINGSEIVNKKIAYDFTGSTPKTITLASGTKSITHEADGTKTIVCSGYFKDAENSLGNATASGSLTLTPLHKAPDIDINGIQVTENVTYLKNTIGIDNDDFINGVSIKTFTISATPYDSATITKFTIQNGSYIEQTTNISSNSGSITMNFQTNPIIITPSSSTLSGSYDRINFTITATDSLGGVTTASFYYNATGNTYDIYNKPTITPTSVTAKRDGQLTGKVILNASGTYDYIIGTTGHTQNLTPTLTMNVYETGSSTLVFTRNITTSDAEFVLSGTSWTLTNLQIGTERGSADTPPSNWFDPAIKYDLVFYVNDAVTTNVSTITPYTYTANVLQGEPTWTEYKDRVDFKRITRKKGEIYGETELYNDASGSTASITLDDSISNYTYLEIFYGWSGFGHQSTRYYVPLGGNVNLGTIVVNNGAIYWVESEWTPTTNKLNLAKGEYWRLQTSGSGTRSTTNQISIYRVVGYK